LYPEHPTEDDKQKYYNFFKSVSFILPCGKCRRHYEENFKNKPINTDSRRTLAIWINEMENEVRITNNKPLIPFTTFIAEYLPQSMYITVNLTSEEVTQANIEHDIIITKNIKNPDSKHDSKHNIPSYFWILFILAWVLVICLLLKLFIRPK
jgi:hypothetical protein